jgi:hypothetical protein
MKLGRMGQNLSLHRGADHAYHVEVDVLLPPTHAHTLLTKARNGKKKQQLRKAMGKKLQAKGRMKENLHEAWKTRMIRTVKKKLQLEESLRK